MTGSPILIAGPTASGKSGVALALAERFDGAVINADASQVYAEWRILTARPAPEDEVRAPHLLYGHIPLAHPYSVGEWLRDVAAALDDCARRKRRPIIVGGTGLYLHALTKGLADIPATPPEVRAAATARLKSSGLAALSAELTERDPLTAAAIDLANPMRVLRAWETLEATGRGLADWRAAPATPLLPREKVVAMVLDPDRGALAERIESRFDAMLEAGALEEARRAASLGAPSDAPGLKALGARELMAFLRGEIALETAVAEAKRNTRRYAKRQMTWFRGRMMSWDWLHQQDSCDFVGPATDLAMEAG